MAAQQHDSAAFTLDTLDKIDEAALSREGLNAYPGDVVTPVMVARCLPIGKGYRGGVPELGVRVSSNRGKRLYVVDLAGIKILMTLLNYRNSGASFGSISTLLRETRGAKFDTGVMSRVYSRWVERLPDALEHPEVARSYIVELGDTNL